MRRGLLTEYFEEKFLLGAGRAMWSMSERVMYVRVSYQLQCGLYQSTNKIACMLPSQPFYGLLFSYLTITDVTSYVDHTVHLTKSLL